MHGHEVRRLSRAKRTVSITYRSAGRPVRGRTTTYAFDGANQLVSSTSDGVTTKYAYDAAGRLVREGDRAYLNDMLGTTVAAKSARRCSAAALTAFGEPLPGAGGDAFFTGKPQVEGLGYAFLYNGLVLDTPSSYGRARTRYGTVRPYGFGSVCRALGDGTVGTSSTIAYSWWEESSGGWRFRHYAWSATVTINYSDVFEDPLDIGIEAPFSKAYSYYHTWNHNVLVGSGTITIGSVEIE